MPPRKSKEPRNDQISQPQASLQDEARQKALDAAMADITKRFGDGSIVRLGDAQHMIVETIPTGSLTVDIALGVGGVPRGRVLEIFGPESSGKTTLCLHVIAEAQRRGGLAAFIDMEHALDPTYAARIGVNLDTLYISQPDTGEQAFEITEALVRSGALDVIVFDSVAAAVPRAEIEGEMGDSFVGVQARLMSQALRKLGGAIKASNVAVLFTNQLREKIGVMYGCFRGDTRVVLADGTTESIETIVKQQLDVEVLSFNHIAGMFESRRVVNWFDNGLADTFLEFTVARADGHGFHTFTCTPNHLVLTPGGYEHAGDLDLGDLLFTGTSAELAIAGVFEASINGNAGETQRAVYRPVPMPILDIRVIEPNEGEHRFDIEVEGNHCYVVDGVVVHNSPETTPGGRALKFYASVRLDIRKLESIKQGSGEVVGNRTRVRVTKNKVAPPFREAEFDIMFLEGGISKSGEVLDLAADLGIIEKRGAFFRYKDGLIGQGRENAKAFLSENLALRTEIENQIRVQYGLSALGSDGKVVSAPANGASARTAPIMRDNDRGSGDDDIPDLG